MVDHAVSLADASPPDVQATFCATLVDEWLRLGVRHAVIAPGSRSTPMALALTERTEMHVHVVHDERVAAFVALGLGVASIEGGARVPALLLCTSGTAAANFLPAVVEAGLSEVPMVVLTADRPEELRGVGAPQTIDQIELYGSHVRWFHDPDVPVAATAGEWRALAGKSLDRSLRGPVHLNLPFREPLVGTPLALPENGFFDPVQASEPENGFSNRVQESALAAERGVILVGGMSGIDADRILDLRNVTAWPIVADPQSGLRDLSDVTTIDSLLRVPGLADELLPEVIVRIGRPAASKVLSQWTARPEPTLLQIGGPGTIDPAANVSAVVGIDELMAAVTKLASAAERDAASSPWLLEWRRLDAVAAAAMETAVEGDTDDVLTEPAVARILAAHAPASAQLTVSSSMPVRDIEWFGGRTPFVHANRGANGIDGVMSTALGRALDQPDGSTPAFVLIGDLAFVHDSNALVALTQRSVDLRVVVVDNDGGGIFSFLPQSNLLEHERFEQLFGTPLGTDVDALAEAHGLVTVTATTADELRAQMMEPGPWVCRVPSDRQHNVTVHESIQTSIAAAIGATRSTSSTI
ncbi:MAG: 2-succinyl-5-enolpyruvyl-6-hydroxy-3-cyclohexene-1-carboxylic-acid synthase [Ilumatobacter sp.]